jgi:hypothetical protein
MLSLVKKFEEFSPTVSNNSQGRIRYFTLASESLSADQSINFSEFKKSTESIVVWDRRICR